MEQACSVIGELETRLYTQQQFLQHVASSVQQMTDEYGQCKSSLDQALSRMVSYEHRLILATRRMSSLTGIGVCLQGDL